MKILVVGCAGFVGSNVINTLTNLIDIDLEGQVSNTFDVFGVDNMQFGYADNVKVNNWSRCGFETLTENYLNDFDVLVHLATANIIYAMDEPIKTFKTNAFDTIELFRKFKGKIIYTSIWNWRRDRSDERLIRVATPPLGSRRRRAIS